MEKNILNKIGNHISYDMYTEFIKKIDKAIWPTIICGNIIIPFDSNMGVVVCFLSAFLAICELVAKLSNFDDYTKDITELKTLYDEFLNNYNKLNTDFNFNNPIEIYTMFKYLLHKGYLSNNHFYKFESSKMIDSKMISGINILDGTGVCRHIAILLADIYNYDKEKNIAGFTLPVYQGNSDKFKDFTIVNHLITVARYNDKAYYFDATQDSMYKISDFDNYLVNRHKDFLRICSLFSNPNVFNIKDLKQALKLPSTDLEDDLEIENKTLLICEANLDIFDKFYNNNKELYQEASNNLKKILKK